MKTVLITLSILAVAAFGYYKYKFGKKTIMANVGDSENVSSIHQFSIKSTNGTLINFADFKGKKILVVNTASECGFTPQYDGLQKLFDQNKDKLVVVGFPCNQFGGQEPGNESSIQTFCKKNYGVNFPLTQKVDVKGDNIHPIYKWLSSKKENGVLDATIKWNFNKFLLDENGVLLAYFSSSVKPDSEEISKFLK